MRFDILNRFSYIASCLDEDTARNTYFLFHLGRAGEPEPVGAGCFWVLGAGAGAAWKKTKSRSRLEKKSGAGAAKNLAGSSALREDKKLKEIVLYLLFF